MPGHLIASEPLHQGVRPIGPFSSTIIGARLGDRGSIMARTGNVAASRGSDPGLHARRLAALLLLALTPAPAVAQRMPQPIFTELFAYDPAEPCADRADRKFPARPARSGRHDQAVEG